jgi:serine/threonine-protein kinase
LKPDASIIGQQLGNYLVQEPLGRGGMARVYKGLDTTLKRPVALKVIEEALRASAAYAQRFEREAQSVANLRHPNIVNVFYFGNQDNLYYLVMEYVDGTDLDAIMRNYGDSGELMPYADVMRILEAIASALDYAHGQGVIHRDVKPSNIILERSGRPVLTDFGLALKVSEGTIGDTFGTPHYISPEQARSSANAVPQSDIYSLGIVAYELLTGNLPFDDPSPTALAMQHLMAAVPSPRVFNPNLASEVEEVLFKALAKAPEERYPSGQVFCAALRQGLEATLRSPDAAKARVPTPPPGLEVPPPRRLSMQTALDKVDQELAMQQAKGQSLTRAAETTETLRAVWRQVNRSSWLPYVVATGVTLVILVVVALILTDGSGGQSSEPTSTTAPTQVVSALTEEATASQIPPTDTTIPPTDTSVPPSETTVQPTSTPESPTATSVPPSETPVPPTPEPPTPIPPTPVPPTPLPVIPTDVPAGATAAPSDWLPVSFVYNNNGFWWLNGASRSISSQPIAFERIGGTGSFTGNRWAYWTMEPGRCMEIRFTDVSNPQRPNGCRPNAFFTPTRTQGIDFWTGSGQFRVLWNGAEIAVCEIAAGQCNAAVPPA